MSLNGNKARKKRSLRTEFGAKSVIHYYEVVYYASE